MAERRDELARTDHRDVYDLMVAGLRDKPADDPVRKKLRLYTPAEVLAATKAVPLPLIWKRRLNGCLICVHEAVKDDFAPLVEAFRSKKRRTAKRKPSSRMLSLEQKAMVLDFFDEDDRPRTLCARHMERVLGISGSQWRRALRKRAEIGLLLQLEREREGEEGEEEEEEEEEEEVAEDDGGHDDDEDEEDEEEQLAMEFMGGHVT